MWLFIQTFIDWVYDIVDVLRLPTFDFSGINVSLFDLMIGGLVISMVVAIVWKGARG